MAVKKRGPTGVLVAEVLSQADFNYASSDIMTLNDTQSGGATGINGRPRRWQQW